MKEEDERIKRQQEEQVSVWRVIVYCIVLCVCERGGGVMCCMYFMLDMIEALD